MSGKFYYLPVRKYHSGEESKGFDNVAAALEHAKSQMAWEYNGGDYNYYIVQAVAKLERPPVENAIVTTL